MAETDLRAKQAQALYDELYQIQDYEGPKPHVEAIAAALAAVQQETKAELQPQIEQLPRFRADAEMRHTDAGMIPGAVMRGHRHGGWIERASVLALFDEHRALRAPKAPRPDGERAK